MKAFNGLALQYFYGGEIDKCEFLLDRVMRGKKENQNSKVRLLALRRLEYQRKEKAYHRVEFKDVHKWADEEEQEEAVRKDYVRAYEFDEDGATDDEPASGDDEDLLGASGSKQKSKKDAKRRYEFSGSKGTKVSAKKSKARQGGPLVGQLGIQPYQYFENAFTQESAPIQIATGTAISFAQPADFPSPGRMNERPPMTVRE